MYEFGEQMERVILAAVQTEDGDDTRQSLAELRDLAETAGADAVATVIQNREAVHPATYLGKGKLEEIRELIYDLDATGVICDDELTPAQMNNLEQELECKIMDRTMVILDIFASRASTSEGKIQVELAQLKYRAARLVGMRASLSRLGGGIGTRGPGEKKLEMDRRLIHHRIGQLKEELAQVQKHRDLIRSQRDKSGTKVAAAEYPDGRLCAGGGQAVCHAGSHHPYSGAAGKTADSPDGYGGIHPEAAPPSD